MKSKEMVSPMSFTFLSFHSSHTECTFTAIFFPSKMTRGIVARRTPNLCRSSHHRTALTCRSERRFLPLGPGTLTLSPFCSLPRYREIAECRSRRCRRNGPRKLSLHLPKVLYDRRVIYFPPWGKHAATFFAGMPRRGNETSPGPSQFSGRRRCGPSPVLLRRSVRIKIPQVDCGLAMRKESALAND
jgi:hypothetical protein